MEKFLKRMKIMSEKIRKKRKAVLIIALMIALLEVSIYAYKQKKSYELTLENSYDMAFYQLVDYAQEVEIYLAKSLISKSPESSTENLTYIWREANLAQTYLSMLPINSSDLENAAKFLNQVSDYSYSLYRKTLEGSELSQEDLDNLNMLHGLSLNLEGTLNQLALDLNNGKISWRELTRKEDLLLSKQVSNLSHDSFSNLEENFHEYAGLIYDGAFSEHITKAEKKGLTGDDINEEKAKNIAIDFVGEVEIKNIESTGNTEHAEIEAYDFTITQKDNSKKWISVSKKGGHIVSMNSNRSVYAEVKAQEEIDEISDKYLKEKGYQNMKKTYYTKNGGVETINYAYEQDGVIVYPDLIKIKVAMDNGEVLGFEASGYLNSHMERKIDEPKISVEEAKKNINSSLAIESERLAIIPTEYQTEILCWEFKGKVENRDFLVYVNAENGKEEDILVVINSDEGTFTM